MSAPDLTLEVELDLRLDTDDVERYRAHIAQGLTPSEAADRIAQDILGGTGAVVQRAEAVKS